MIPNAFFKTSVSRNVEIQEKMDAAMDPEMIAGISGLKESVLRLMRRAFFVAE